MTIENEIKSVIKNFANIDVVKIKLLGSGSFGKVYKCTDYNNKNYAIKVYFSSGIAETEAKSLKALSQNNGIKIPEVYFTALISDGYAYDLMFFEYINGKNALFNIKLLLSSKKKKKIFANNVIDALLEIHSIKSDKFGDISNPIYDTWLDYYRPFAERILLEAKEKNKNACFDKYILDTMLKAWNHFDKIFYLDITESSLIHGDINVMNIMVDNHLMPIAFIDPLNTIYADREYDLFQLQNLTGNCFDLYNTYKSKYEVSENCDIKCAFYSLWNEAMVYINTGKYTKFIMKSAVNNMNQCLKQI